MLKSLFYLISIAFLFQACGAGGKERPVIKIAADSSTYTMVKALGAAFAEKNTDVAFELQIRNEPTAISGFVEGQTDILFSKRQLFIEEIASIEHDSLKLVERPLASGAVVVLSDEKEDDLIFAENRLQYTQGVVHEDPLIMRYVNGPTLMVPGKKELRAQVMQNEKYLAMLFMPASEKLDERMSPLKVQPINRIMPTFENVKNKSYPLIQRVFIQFCEPQTPTINRITQYLASTEAKEVLKENNWVPVNNN